MASSEQRGCYCSRCGFFCQESFLFCPKCGKDVNKTNRQQSSGPSTSTVKLEKLDASLQSLKAFSASKESERQSFFVRQKSNKKRKVDDEEVVIAIAILKQDLTLKRGESLPLKIRKAATSKEILEASLKKHTAFNKRFNGKQKHMLTYRDGTEVETVPGSTEQFTLLRYKEESGFSYGRLTLYLMEVARVPVQIHLVVDEPDTKNNHVVDDSDDDELFNCPSFLECESDEIFNKDGNPIHQPATRSDVIKMCECPTCFHSFKITEIAAHADACAAAFCTEEPIPTFLTLDNVPVSAEIHTEFNDDPLAIKNKIASLRAKHINTEEEPIRVTVRRKHIWDDYKRARANYYKPDRALKITFAGEPAVDDGGPKREFFAELLKFVEQRLFTNGTPVQSTMSLTKGDYKIAGEIMALSIMQEGQAPSFLSPVIYSYLCDHLCVENMNSTSYKDLCEKLNSASEEEIGNILMNDDVYPVLENVGYKGVPCRETKITIKELIKAICVMDQVGEVFPQLQQLQEGLATYGILNSVKEYPEDWKCIFTHSKGIAITANKLIDQIVPEYHESQILREQEGDTFLHFCEFLQNLETGGIADVSVQDLLQWCTGARNVPPLGFPRALKCQFLHGCVLSCRCRPTTSTCDLVFTLPVHIKSGKEMEELMVSALKDSVGFGLL